MVEAALLKEIKDSVRMFVSGGVVDQAGNRSADRVFPLHIFREWEQRPFALHYAETLRKYGVYPARDPVSMRVTYTPKGVIALSIETTPPNERIPLKWQYFCGFTETTGDGSISARELLITRGQNGAQDTTQEIDRQTKASTDAEIQLFARFLKKSHHPKAI